MNLTKSRSVLIIILIVAVVLVILIIVTLIVGFVSPKPRPRVSPPPTPTTTPPISLPTASPKTKLKQRPGFETELAKISQFLPYNGANFNVEYVAPLNLINAKIKAGSEDEYFATKTQIEEFIKSKGVTDICKLNIFWIPQVNQKVREVLKNSGSALVTTGCRAF